MPTAFLPPDFFRRYSVSDMFGCGVECEVDLGCGDGGFLLAMAQHEPDRLFLGVERLLGRVRKVCSRADRLGQRAEAALPFSGSVAEREAPQEATCADGFHSRAAPCVDEGRRDAFPH